MRVLQNAEVVNTSPNGVADRPRPPQPASTAPASTNGVERPTPSPAIPPAGVPTSVNEKLTCKLCRSLFSDPVVTPCCFATYCSACVRQAILSNSHLRCPSCGVKGISTDDLRPNRGIAKAVQDFKSGNSPLANLAKNQPKSPPQLSIRSPTMSAELQAPPPPTASGSPSPPVQAAGLPTPPAEDRSPVEKATSATSDEDPTKRSPSPKMPSPEPQAKVDRDVGASSTHPTTLDTNRRNVTSDVSSIRRSPQRSGRGRGDSRRRPFAADSGRRVRDRSRSVDPSRRRRRPPSPPPRRDSYRYRESGRNREREPPAKRRRQ